MCLKDKNWCEVSRVKQVIQRFMFESVSGYQVRGCIKDTASEETASLFDANQELKNAKRNSLDKLKVNGVSTDKQDVIEEEVINFFNALFNGHHDSNLTDTGFPFRGYEGLFDS